MTNIQTKRVTRRSFLKGSSAVAAGFAVSGVFGSGFIRTTTPSTGAAALRSVSGERSTVYTACAMCPSECGLAVEVEGGIVSAIYGNDFVPFNAGTVCAKGASGAQFVYNANRIKYPMLRVGDRGEGN